MGSRGERKDIYWIVINNVGCKGWGLREKKDKG